MMGPSWRNIAGVTRFIDSCRGLLITYVVLDGILVGFSVFSVSAGYISIKFITLNSDYQKVGVAKFIVERFILINLA